VCDEPQFHRVRHSPAERHLCDVRANMSMSHGIAVISSPDISDITWNGRKPPFKNRRKPSSRHAHGPASAVNLNPQEIFDSQF